jgi:alkylated DNA repair dioxygenase AlkB
MSVQTVCVGWHWQPYRYTRTASDVNGAQVAPFPDWLRELGRRALVDAYEDDAAGDGYDPDTALINFYDGAATMGMHQDKDERAREPVVSLSVGANRTRTWSWSPETCWSSEDRRGSPSTGCRRCTPAPATLPPGSPGAA